MNTNVNKEALFFLIINSLIECSGPNNIVLTDIYSKYRGIKPQFLLSKK